MSENCVKTVPLQKIMYQITYYYVHMHSTYCSVKDVLFIIQYGLRMERRQVPLSSLRTTRLRVSSTSISRFESRVVVSFIGRRLNLGLLLFT